MCASIAVATLFEGKRWFGVSTLFFFKEFTSD